MLKLSFFIILCSFSVSSYSDTLIESGTNQGTLIELYSSQGCSSCPPAERWVSNYRNDPNLWKSVFPVVFHVDYWDYLGWKDPFSQKEFSQRQRNYHRSQAIRSVYTPGVIVNGKEYRQWYRGHSLPTVTRQVGNLILDIKNNSLTSTYSEEKPLSLSIAILAMDISTSVKSGENAGREFTENFIVLSLTTVASPDGKWQLNLDIPADYKRNKLALVSWVTEPQSLQPLQVAGGWLE